MFQTGWKAKIHYLTFITIGKKGSACVQCNRLLTLNSSSALTLKKEFGLGERGELLWG
jgi:hypothetical protein